MKKPAQLRDLLTRVVPHLKSHPDALLLFVDKGSIAARIGATLSFEQRYSLNLVVQDFAGDPNTIFVPLLAWIAQAQPELLTRADSAPFTFESELLDADTCDLSVILELTERVAVTPRDGGGYEVRHLEEPATADIFPGVCDATLLQLYFGPDLIAASTSA